VQTKDSEGYRTLARAREKGEGEKGPPEERCKKKARLRAWAMKAGEGKKGNSSLCLYVEILRRGGGGGNKFVKEKGDSACGNA